MLEKLHDLTQTMVIVDWAAISLAAMLAIELALRRFGLGNPLLYIADEQIGYLVAPNQILRRAGREIRINAFSMRSDPIAPTRPPETLRILLLGDSIAFGNSRTDQHDTIAAHLQRMLSASHNAVEVLTAAASSWSPRNELAYIDRFGCFEAQFVLLLLNTDDLFGTAPTSVRVGRDRHYPNRKPLLAIAELISRYWPQPPLPPTTESGDVVGRNLQAIEQIGAIATQANAQFLLAMTPLLRELQAGSRDYEQRARQRLQELTQQRQIVYCDFLETFQAVSAPASLYDDSIHLSLAGHQQVSDVLRQAIAALAD